MNIEIHFCWKDLTSLFSVFCILTILQAQLSDILEGEVLEVSKSRNNFRLANFVNLNITMLTWIYCVKSWFAFSGEFVHISFITWSVLLLVISGMDLCCVLLSNKLIFVINLCNNWHMVIVFRAFGLYLYFVIPIWRLSGSDVWYCIQNVLFFLLAIFSFVIFWIISFFMYC